jgi:hypothetical protein
MGELVSAGWEFQFPRVQPFASEVVIGASAGVVGQRIVDFPKLAHVLFCIGGLVTAVGARVAQVYIRIHSRGGKGIQGTFLLLIPRGKARRQGGTEGTKEG